jgi:hypothetical protein
MRQSLKVALLSVPVVLLWSVYSSTVAVAADEHDRGRAEQRPESRRPAESRGREESRGPGVARPSPGRPAGPVAGVSRPSFDGRGQVLDGRYNHGRYYPPAGSYRPSLPESYRPYYRGGHRYYFSGGAWYEPRGGGFVVIRPPSGLVISVLPPFYSTVWFGGAPYYYADNVYYTWQPDQNGYAVVDPPPDADVPAPPPDRAQDDLMIYPKNGQTKEQQAADQFECHDWAKGQTGFDPTLPGGGSSGDADAARSNYNRAISACLQGRGYQVN